jgi:hypothetical protein
MLQFFNPPGVEKFDFPIGVADQPQYHDHNSTTNAVWENKFVNFWKVDKLKLTTCVTPG